MKKIIIAAVLSIMACNASAKDLAQVSKVCGNMSEMAANIMTFRQYGGSMAEQIKITAENEAPAQVKSIMLEWTQSAYETPMFKPLMDKKIYFGHQSVGFNILDGVSEILKNNPSIKLNIIK